ncbi:MAG: hypothetical protein C4K48_07345 [Candidatus Thorarchaeota archaeon]|nr:MAG: hypothetical protein C4K48_07345 [Candidatus Thorarchaeota archaeon]
MASTTTYVQVTHERNLVSDMIAALLERLNETERERMSAWSPLVEEHAEQLIHGLKRKTTSKRRLEILTAAALYDAFLEYESRTHVRCRLSLMKETFGLPTCSINAAWIQLFNNRAALRKGYSNTVYTNESSDHREAVNAILADITWAVVEMTEDVETYIGQIREQACQLLERMDCTKAEEHEPILVAGAAVYAAICTLHGKRRIQVSQRDLSNFCNYSPSMLSKAWLGLFASLVQSN